MTEPQPLSPSFGHAGHVRSASDGGFNPFLLTTPAAQPSPVTMQRYSFRQALLLGMSVLFLCVCLPYLFFGAEHADSCYVERSPRKIQTEEMMAEARIKNATLGLDVPTVEAVESSPEAGRGRLPAFYYRHQTLIMIGLLLACLFLKLLYAVWYYRPATSQHVGAMADSVELGMLDESRLKLQKSTTPNARRSTLSNAGTPKNNTPPLSARTLAVPSPLPSTSFRTLIPTHQYASGSPSHPSPSPLFPFLWLEVFRLVFAYLWYLAAYFLCNALKSILGDFSCSTHGNSVSGHYLFHLYALWMVAYLHLAQKHLHVESVLSAAFWRKLLLSAVGMGLQQHSHAHSSPSQHHQHQHHAIDTVFLVVFCTYAFVVFSILLDTYFYGYHSLRQIIYGSLLALVVFLGATGVFEAVEDRVATYPGYAAVKGLSSITTAGSGGAGPGESTGNLTVIAKEHQQAAAGAAASVVHNPALSLAYWPFFSGVLHEWLHTDERRHRFYSFPVVALASFQCLAFLALYSSPRPGFFHNADLGALAVGYAFLLWVWKSKLRLPPRAGKMGVSSKTKHDVEA